MKITQKGIKDICTKYDYVKEDNFFRLLNDNGQELSFIDPKIKLDDEYDPHNFEIMILHNDRDDCTENSIYQVKVDKMRIGWLFPIQALHSAEHEYSEDVYFLKYAYVAWCILLSECEKEVESIYSFDLFDIYSEDTCLLVMDKENCRKIDGFQIDKYMISLFHNGYSEKGHGNIFPESIYINRNINLKRLSSELDSISYINDIFLDQIPIEKKPISRFHIYYQIIEILIGKVFSDLFIEFISSLDTVNDDLFEKKEELSRDSNEKRRINILCNQCCQIDSSLKNSLNDCCLRLLKYTKSKTSDSVNDNLYQVRCLIVHRMYVLDSEAEEILKEVDDWFLELIIQLVFTYSNERRKRSCDLNSDRSMND